MESKMIYVRTYYFKVVREYGQSVGSKFLSLMQEWDGSKNTIESFYEEDILDMKLKEALEFNI